VNQTLPPLVHSHSLVRAHPLIPLV
jgi:hypothetical protein